MIFAEFLYNNTVLVILKITLFFANYGFYPRAEWEPDPGGIAEAPNLSEETVILLRFNGFLRYEMLYAQDIYKDFANRRRIPAPVFNTGE